MIGKRYFITPYLYYPTMSKDRSWPRPSPLPLPPTPGSLWEARIRCLGHRPGPGTGVLARTMQRAGPPGWSRPWAVESWEVKAPGTSSERAPPSKAAGPESWASACPPPAPHSCVWWLPQSWPPAPESKPPILMAFPGLPAPHTAVRAPPLLGSLSGSLMLFSLHSVEEGVGRPLPIPLRTRFPRHPTLPGPTMVL